MTDKKKPSASALPNPMGPPRVGIMAAPAPTARGTPTGTMLDNGYQSMVTFASNATLGLWEKTVTPMGLEGGDKVEITTMHNVTVKTYGAQALYEATDAQMTVAYDPIVLSAIVALINVYDTLTILFPDQSTWTMYGYLKNFQASPLVNGTQPEATCTIVATNVDQSDGSEAVPVYTVAPTP